MTQDAEPHRQYESKFRSTAGRLVASNGQDILATGPVTDKNRVRFAAGSMIGTSAALTETLRKVDLVAETDANVLIFGETGTGKELIARAIHARGPRRARPLVRVSCASIPGGLFESELFGHVKGAFTGALADRAGRFQRADGGTLLLDEVGELPLDTQAKLLRVLQEREFEAVGSDRTRSIDVRLIVATNRNLAQAVARRHFRADLYYRLNVFPIDVPALRERRKDIPVLAGHFLEHYAKVCGKSFSGISEASMEWMKRYAWPGNVRELKNSIERAVILSRGRRLHVEAEAPSGFAGVPCQPPDGEKSDASPCDGEDTAFPTLDAVQRQHISAALVRCRGTVEGDNGAAQLLGLHPSTLRARMRKLGVRSRLPG